MRSNYCLITPCRNEARYAPRALESVLAQSRQPGRWVIVDDGSSDRTPEILAEYAERHDFIRVIRRQDRGARSVGPGVVDAFRAGYESIRPHDYGYMCKLDLDVELPPRYFEILVRRMEDDPRIGTCSGKPYFRDARGRLISEKCGDEMSVGMTKFYRVACFEDIGGFVPEVMWDGIDCHRCRMRGWVACSWDDPELRFEHLRPMGSSQRSIWAGRARHGFGQYFMGTRFPYMLASSVFRMTRPPFVLGGAAMLWGYLSSAMIGKPRYDDREFRRFLRRYQRDSLLLGKREATRRIHERIARVPEDAFRASEGAER